MTPTIQGTQEDKELLNLEKQLKEAEEKASKLKDEYTRRKNAVAKTQRENIVKYINENGIDKQALINELGFRIDDIVSFANTYKIDKATLINALQNPQYGAHPNNSASAITEKTKVVKYRNPETGKLHSGLGGRKPKWLQDAIDTGKKEDFRIPDEDLPKYNPHLLK